MIFNGIKLIFSALGTEEEYHKMLDFVSENDVRCITEHFEFEDFEKAFDRLENG